MLADEIKARGGYDAWVSHDRDAGTAMNAERWGAGQHGLEKLKPFPVLVEPGQAYLAHQKMAHNPEPNVFGGVRNAVYFRLMHPTYHHKDNFDRTLCWDLWKNYGGCGGTWQPALSGPAADARHVVNEDGDWVEYTSVMSGERTYWYNTQTGYCCFEFEPSNNPAYYYSGPQDEATMHQSLDQTHQSAN